MIIVPDCDGHRIEIEAVAVDGRWNAEVRVRHDAVEDKAHVETVMCYKLTAELAEAHARAARCGLLE